MFTISHTVSVIGHRTNPSRLSYLWHKSHTSVKKSVIQVVITKTSPYSDRVTAHPDTAPFVITHHSDGGEWHDSPVLRSLITFTVVVSTEDGSIYEGEFASVNEDGTVTLTNASGLNAWATVSLRLNHIATIHYN